MFVSIEVNPSLNNRWSEVHTLMVEEMGGTNIVWGATPNIGTVPLKIPRTLYCIFPSLTPKDFSAKLAERLDGVFKEGGWVILTIASDGQWFHQCKPLTSKPVSLPNVVTDSDMDVIRG